MTRIGELKYIQNVGRFETVDENSDVAFKELTLVYSENGRGKSTLSAILRSLATADAAPILERRRLSAKAGSSRVVVRFDGRGKEAVFNGSAWTAAGPEVLVFDEHFVDSNIYSGLSVSPGHRQNLHKLVIGEKGILHNRRVEDLTQEIATLQSDLREQEQTIPEAIRNGFSIDDFCALVLPKDLAGELEAAKKSLSILRDASRIRTTAGFESFAVPLLPSETIAGIVGSGLPDLEALSLKAVMDHFASLESDRAESWVAEGMEIASELDSCPFCGLSLSRSILIAHYQAYFSEAYRDHTSRIAEAHSKLSTDFSGDNLARFQRLIQEAKQRHEFWSRYVKLPTFDLPSEDLVQVWTEARDALVAALDRKTKTPLENFDLDQDAARAIVRYAVFTEKVRAMSAALLDKGEGISRAKEQAAHGSLAVAGDQVARLEAIQRRHEPATAENCEAYLTTKEAKVTARAKKEVVKTALDEHRKTAFGICERLINDFLLKFNADFSIRALKSSDARGITSSTYEIVINKKPIALAAANTPEPSFRTGLSSGDRTTLALAFFFATLQEHPSLNDSIVVLDDPASSLDDGRAFATVQEIRSLLGRVSQVIVMSHSMPLLCQLWERADKNNTSTIQISNAGEAASTLEPWDAEAAATTEYDRLHRLVREYAQGAKGKRQEVAPALRLVLESFLRTAFVEYFPPGKTLGHFLTAARKCAVDRTPILPDDDLTELDKLREYASQFHHDKDKSRPWQQNISNVNEKELGGFADRVLKFTRLFDNRGAARSHSA